ncbi:protein TolR [Acidihalobacter ferrooxydans]|uniref:Protein TolR n=1 Tax=Acidihalobacter ferrooxydans TaxID=1765967 RepID=A0A1P8UHQ1_9GAMM|nr:protein TolR [Acidihalobacter ferrooxydans]APZ43378.1 protein TolR [Acidihalobacter ferrooxydans]
MAQINVVPYIDVMLVLLVIFLVTAPLLKQGVQVDLPKAAAKPIPSNQHAPSPLTVTINAQGSYFVSRGAPPTQPLDAAALRQIVSKQLQQDPKMPVYVKGDNHVNYGRVVLAMTILQHAGANKVGLITAPPPKKP